MAVCGLIAAKLCVVSWSGSWAGPRSCELRSRIPVALSQPLQPGRRLIWICRAHVLVRKPHAPRWRRLIQAVGRRYDVPPRAVLAQEDVETRTTPDGAVNARGIGVRDCRDAEKSRDDHGGHRDNDRSHNR